MKKIVLALFIGIIGTSFGQIENTWTKMSDFSGLKRERAVAFSIGDYGYIGTGIDTAEVVYNDLWKYDATLDAWSQVASLPGSVRRNAIAFSINDKGYIGTGINSSQANAHCSVNGFRLLCNGTGAPIRSSKPIQAMSTLDVGYGLIDRENRLPVVQRINAGL